MATAAYSESISHAVMTWLAWTSPNFWIVLGALLFIVGLVHPVPWELKKDEESFGRHAVLFVRRTAVKTLAIVMIALPVGSYLLFCLTAGAPQSVASDSFMTWATDRLLTYGPATLGVCIAGFVLRGIIDRYAMPRWSAFWRANRKQQDSDTPVDARDEAGALEVKTFTPEQYFREGKIFYGLDRDGQPIYLDLMAFYVTHHAILGPTGYGKGVLTQNIVQQAIRLMMTVIMVDPKGDDYIPYLLRAEAERAGRRFVYLDLNPSGPGSWHPFVGGDARRRRARIVSAFNLAAGGTDADVYKARERRLLDQALQRCNGEIRELNKALVAIENDSNSEASELSTLRDTLEEWAKVSTFASKNPGHQIARSLMENAVVYVRGSLNDNVVKLATRAYIAEVCSELERLFMERPAHCLFGISELKFMASEELASALATIRGFRTNLILDAQSVANLEAPDDHRVNGKSLVREFEVNTMAKFMYKAGDAATAKAGEELSGTQFLQTVRSEVLEVNKSGGEQWEARKTMGREEHPLVSRNTLLYLPPRVAVAYLPNRLPTLCFTSPVPTDRSVPLFTARPAAEPAVSQASTEPGDGGEGGVRRSRGQGPAPSTSPQLRPPTKPKRGKTAEHTENERGTT